MYVDQILGKCRDGANCRDHLPGLTKTQSHQDTLCRYNKKILGSRSNLDVNRSRQHGNNILQNFNHRGITVLLKVYKEERIKGNMIPTLSTGKLQAR